MDPLDDAFAAMRVRESLYARLDASAPWAVRFREGKAARFGLVIAGTCWLTTDGPTKSIPLAPGDCYVILDGSTYTLGDDPRSTPQNCFDVVPRAGRWRGLDRRRWIGGDRRHRMVRL